jgi:hypothetical protein
VVVGAALVSGSVLLALGLSGPSAAPGGDPAGRILTQLRSLEEAVPGDATGVSFAARPARREGACPARPADGGGWGPVAVTIGFAGTGGPSAVLVGVDGTLRALGWRPASPPAPGAGRWVKEVAPGVTAVARLTQAPSAAGGRWTLTARAHPPGFRPPCPA